MKFLKFWFPVILYSAIIFCVSALPNLEAPVGWFFFDKLAHVIEYAVLGFLFARALFYSLDPKRFSKRQIIWMTLLFCLLYGASDEFHQLFVIGREAGLPDVIADSIGGFLGSIIYKR